MIRDNVPEFLRDIYDLKTLFDAEQPQIDELLNAAEDMLKEFRTAFFSEKTAQLWEELCGLTPAPAWNIDRRRERVRSRICVPSNITAEALKEIIEYTGGVEVELVEIPEEYTVIVRFVGEKGIPQYLDDIFEAVNRIRPFHIKVEPEFTWAKLQDLSTEKLEDMADKQLLQMAVL